MKGTASAKNKNNDEVKKRREFSASTLVERSPKEKAIPPGGYRVKAAGLGCSHVP